jgi:hypothetical protein
MRPEAFRLAIDVLHFPAKARLLRSSPLPDDVFDLIRVACGDKQAVAEAANVTGRPRQLLRDAAGFFVEQVLFYPGSDAYRVLGARRDATYQELRRNMAALLRWLHPDGDRHGERAVFASRVTEAWDNLKTEDRRAAYDRERYSPHDQRSGPRQSVSSTSIQSRSTAKLSPSRTQRKPISASKRQFAHPVYAYRETSLLRRFLLLFFGKAMP